MAPLRSREASSLQPLGLFVCRRGRRRLLPAALPAVPGDGGDQPGGNGPVLRPGRPPLLGVSGLLQERRLLHAPDPARDLSAAALAGPGLVAAPPRPFRFTAASFRRTQRSERRVGTWKSPRDAAGWLMELQGSRTDHILQTDPGGNKSWITHDTNNPRHLYSRHCSFYCCLF